MNLKLCGIAAGAAFVLSLLVGTFSGGYFGISLLRALFFGVVFFILAGVIWMCINRFLPELLIPREEEPLMSGLEAGSRVNISVGDDDMSANAAIPLENNSRGDLGNVAEMVAKGSRAQSGGQNLAAPPPGSIPGRPGGGQTPGSPVLDLGAEAGYSRNGVPVAPGGGNQSGAPAASGPAAPAEDPGVVFVPSAPPSPLQSFSGGDIESLPDLDAMAGAFVSSGEEDGEESAASVPIFGAEPKSRAPGKARSREDDYNPKEVASAIQTILKRD
jgi:hypothetical protein